MLFKPTIMVIVGMVLFGTAYDIWAVAHDYEWTISANLWHIARDTNYGPAVVAVSFFLLGHVLFPNKSALRDAFKSTPAVTPPTLLRPMVTIPPPPASPASPSPPPATLAERACEAYRDGYLCKEFGDAFGRWMLASGSPPPTAAPAPTGEAPHV